MKVNDIEPVAYAVDFEDGDISLSFSKTISDNIAKNHDTESYGVYAASKMQEYAKAKVREAIEDYTSQLSDVLDDYHEYTDECRDYTINKIFGEEAK